MAELLRDLKNLQAIPNETHWFCPKRNDADDISHLGEDDFPTSYRSRDGQARPKVITDALERTALALRALQVLSFDGEGAKSPQEEYLRALKAQLTRCDLCIRAYYQALPEFFEDLQGEFQEDQVTAFRECLDNHNIERIKSGLAQAKSDLIHVPAEERGVSKVDPVGLFGLFEALSCPAFLADEELLTKHFDEPFQLIQSKRRLKVTSHTPAGTRFLFGEHELRRSWALKAWNGVKGHMTKRDFEWAVRDHFEQAMERVQIHNLERDFLSHFWNGCRSILGHLNKDLVTHCLRAMNVDVYRLALDHLVLEFEGFPNLMACFQILLVQSPDDFWDAMGAISAVTVIEQLFNSPSLERMFLTVEGDQGDNLEDLTDALSWVDPLLDSLKPNNLAPACRTLADQFFQRLQKDKYSSSTQDFCRRVGLLAFSRALKSLTRAQENKAPVSEVTISEMLDMVVDQIPGIAADIRAARSSTKYSSVAEIGLQIIQHSVALDCESLVVDFERLTSSEALPTTNTQSTKTQSDSLWKVITDNITKNDVKMASKFLLGCRELAGIEPFAVAADKISPDLKWFNESFRRVSGHICNLLEKLSDFSEKALRELFETPTSASGIFATLFASDQRVHDAALEVLKAASSSTGRREAVESAMNRSLTTTLSMTENYASRIATKRVFNPMPRAIKFCGDIVDVLCNSQEGILRRGALSSQEVTNVQNFWAAMWRMLNTIFKYTESWSRADHEKDLMRGFCRDTMQFAEGLFGSYSIFFNAIQQVSQDERSATSNVGVELLRHPTSAMFEVAKWLRLRDEYLYLKSVSMVCMLLRRLKAESVQLEERTFKYIEAVVRKTVRTNLSRQECAELRGALEENLGRELDLEEDDKNKPSESKTTSKGRQSQLNLGDWKSKADSQKTSGNSTTGRTTSKASAFKDSKGTSQKLPTREPIGKSLPKPYQPVGPGIDVNEFRRIRQQEKEAKEKRDAAARAKAFSFRAGGSGAQGIGVEGKDHAPKDESIYVDSDETSDEEAKMDAELFGTPIVKSNKARKAADKKEELPQLPVKKKKIIRSKGEMRARLAPDLSKLHATLLCWDYFHYEDYPPGSASDRFSAVTNRFMHPGKYRDVFQGLLELEAWQGFARSREENSLKPYGIKIANRANVDAFVELGTAMTHADNKEIQIMEGDVVLLSKDKSPGTAAEAPHCLARVHRVARKQGQLEILYRAVPGKSAFLMPGSSIFGLKIQSLTPLEREYGSLCSFQYYDLCDDILAGKPSRILQYSDQQLEEFIGNYNVNKAQAKAVKSAIENDGFTLIQGPPGSGKTKTIVAIVGALLSSSLKSTNGHVMQKPGATSGTAATGTSTSSKKLLVCAPSNAAVDELVLRLKQGIKTLSGAVKKVNVVRIGRSDAINAQVRDVTLEELVNARLAAMPGQDNDKMREKVQKIMEEHKKVSASLRDTRAEMDAGTATGDAATKLTDQYHALKKRKAELGVQVDASRDEQNNQGRQAELNRRQEQQRILDGSDIICATLSGSGHEMFRNLNVEFETVIVDEAAQCVEMSALIPLKYGCIKCILVGDPKQLPPTVFSREAARFRYEQSLFVRMQENHPEDVHLLDTQYRMHPDISYFPSQAFYEGRLLDGKNMATLRQRPWHTNKILSPYRFFDVKGQHQAAPKGHSLVNYAEIRIAISLYTKLESDYRDYNFQGKIGIITPYKSQLHELKDQFVKRFGPAIYDRVEFNTTDAYQGREREIIIFSCVRASSTGGVGFLQDIRRMNVGLTRAKSSLWVLGNSDSLMRGEWWNKLIENAKKRNAWTDGDLTSIIEKSSGGKWDPPRVSEEESSPAHSPRPILRSPVDTGSGDTKMSDPSPVQDVVKGSTQQSSDKPVQKDSKAKRKLSESADIEMKDADEPEETKKKRAKIELKSGDEEKPLAIKKNGDVDKMAHPTAHKTPRPTQAPGSRPAGAAPKRRKPVDPFMPASRQGRR